MSGVEIELKFEITGQNSLDAEFRGFQALLAQGMKKSLQEVNKEMQQALQKQIETDVYDGLYYPTRYKRRSSNSTFGPQLTDMRTNIKDAETTSPIVGQNEITAETSFDYFPSGKHSVKKWSGPGGNELIGRIEKKSPPYNWGNDIVPERPFWQHFVESMVDGGEAERLFVEAINNAASLLEVEAGGSVERESGDGAY